MHVALCRGVLSLSLDTQDIQRPSDIKRPPAVSFFSTGKNENVCKNLQSGELLMSAKGLKAC